MSDEKVFVASPEAKSKAKTFRIIAFICWLVAIGLEIYAILKLLNNESMTWLIVAIVVILILAVTGNILWKKANRLDPASKKDKTRFFIQNQLGAIMSVLALLPLVILIYTNKDMDGKTKGIVRCVPFREEKACRGGGTRLGAGRVSDGHGFSVLCGFAA